MGKEYNIDDIVSRIRNCGNIDTAVTQLKDAYAEIICHFSNRINSALSKQILLLNDNVRPRYWNCVNIHNTINKKMLWMSINPSGAVKDKTGNYHQEKENCDFNPYWNPNDTSNYWKTLISNIGPELLSSCGHIDILPIHLSKEKDVWNRFFKDTSSVEFQLVVDLVRCSQSILEKIQPKLIVYSNISSRWLWGFNNSGWLGYRTTPVEDYFKKDKDALECINDLRSSISGYWHNKPGMGMFLIDGIAQNNISNNATTNLRSFLLLDYQVANYTWRSSSLQPGDINKVWDAVNFLEHRKF